MNSEKYRPHYHFTPRKNWMNDPNGLVYDRGEYHLFYQYNPYSPEWGNMSWGHAVSPDLVRWTHLDPAILEEPSQAYTIFSGSAVIDVNNTAGFGAGAMVALYTADYRDPRLQDIHIAYSNDSGRTFTKYAGNPVIAIGERKFGDPKVFWHAESGKWVMVNICGYPQGHVKLYGSPNLKNWEFLSEFHAPESAPGIWECPDLFPLAVDGDPMHIRWVLKTNYVKPGGDFSGTRYFAVDFDGEAFTEILPLGPSFTSDQGTMYAEVTYNHAPDGQRILLGWLRQQPVAERPWTGAQSLPRVLTLHTTPSGLELRQSPVVTLQALRSAGVQLADVALTGKLPLDVDVSGAAVEVIAEFVLENVTEVGLRLNLAKGAVRVGYTASGDLFIECTGQPRISVPLPAREGRVKLHIFFDQDIVEVFGGHGEAGITTWLDFQTMYRDLQCFAFGKTRVTAHAWSMTS